MELVGHKTQSVYDRYAIVAEQDLRDGVKRVAVLKEASGGSGYVLPMRKGGMLIRLLSENDK